MPGRGRDSRGRNIGICGRLGALYKKSPDAESPKQHTSSLEQSIGMVWSKRLQNVPRKNKTLAHLTFTLATRKPLRPHDTFEWTLGWSEKFIQKFKNPVVLKVACVYHNQLLFYNFLKF
jgi:hypothetical protein